MIGAGKSLTHIAGVLEVSKAIVGREVQRLGLRV